MPMCDQVSRASGVRNSPRPLRAAGQDMHHLTAAQMAAVGRAARCSPPVGDTVHAVTGAEVPDRPDGRVLAVVASLAIGTGTRVSED